MRPTAIHNWSGDLSWNPDAIHHPVAEEQVCALVGRAANEATRIKGVGSALSWSDAIDIPGEAMRFDQMARVLDVDPVAGRIRLQGGATLDAVNEVLAETGLALVNFGSITRQTVAGYLGTASHGTGGRTQLLSSQVTGLRLVDGLGDVHELDSERDETFGSIPVHQEAEYAIPRDYAAAAIDEVRTMVLNTDGYRVNFPFEVRFAAADQIPMSPVYGRDVCYLGAYIASRKWAAGYFADFEELVRDYQGRPHWGKTFTRTADELRSLFPAYEEFDQHRRRLDPAGVFRNSFVDRVFPHGDDPAGEMKGVDQGMNREPLPRRPPE